MKKFLQIFAGSHLPWTATIAVALAVPGVHASCTPPPTGLVSWWRAEGNGNDSFGTNNASVPPGVSYAASAVGLGFDLEGNTNRIVAPDAPSLNFGSNQSFSVEAWIQPLANPGNYTDSSGEIMTVVSKRYNPDLLTALGYEMFLAGGRLSFQMDDVLNEYHNYNAGPDLRDGNFHHVAITVQRNSTNGIVFYVDGQMIATFDPTVTPGDLSNTEPLRIGNHPMPNLAGFYHGIIDEVSLYNRALAPGEIEAIYNAGSAGKCVSNTVTTGCTATPTGLVGWWKGDGSATDAISGNNGTLVNCGYTNGAVGQAFSFDPENFPFGTYTSVQIADQPAYALTNSLTIETWVRPRGNGYYVFFRGDNRPGLDPYGLSFQGNNVLWFNITDASGNGAVVATTVSYNGWTHIAATLDGGTGLMSIYTNGVLAVQSNTPVRPFGPLIAADSPGVGIGNVNDGSNQFPFIGDIDEVSLYNRALSATEVAAIYNAGSAGKCNNPNNCVAFTNFNSIAGLTLTGSAAVTTNGILRLTPATASQTGDVWLTGKTACAGGFDTTFHFQITQLGNIYGNEPGGDGFTFSVQNSSQTNLAWAMGDTNNYVSVFFNTFWNWPGCVCPDVSDNSVGILINQNYVTQTDLNPTGINLSDGNVHSGRVLFDGSTLTVWVDNQIVLTNVPVPGLQPGVDSGGNGWVGFTAGTGGAYENHDILDWSFCPNANSTGTNVQAGPPAIFNFSPNSGSNGTLLAIVGTNFSSIAAANTVYFGAVRANVLAASPGSLIAFVPVGATYGPITVTVGGLTAASGRFFEPTFNGNGSNLTASSFAPSFNLGAGGSCSSSVIADLDGDGKPDIALVSGSAHAVSIFRNISTNGAPLSAASFAPRMDLPLPTNGVSGDPYKLCAADLDGDGKLDLIATEAGGNRVSVFHNIATPGALTINSFEPAFALIAGSDCRFAAAADLDADGRLDLVALNYGDKTVSIFKNLSGAGSFNASSFAAPITLADPAGPDEAVVADLDGDGRPDLAIGNVDNTTISIFQNLAGAGVLNTNSFAPRLDLPAEDGNQAMAVADLDGDGKLDLICGSFRTETISVYRNLGSTGLITTNSFAPHVDFPSGNWSFTVAVGDLNGDGKPDISEVGQLPSTLSLFQNLGAPGAFTTASLAARVDLGAGWNAAGVAVGDLDGDGRPDIVFCNIYDSTIQIYQNATPFGAPSVAPTITAQPTNLTATAGTTANFAVTAAGTQPLFFQWYFNGTNLPNATNATLVLSNVQPAQAGNYFVTITNLAGSAVSSNAVLAVTIPPTPPAIVSQTPGQIVLVGGTAIFGVNVSGSTPLSYQWSRNGAPIPDGTNSVYFLANAQLTDSGSTFSCFVTNLYGTASSTNITLKVLDTVANDLCSGAIVITNASYTNVQSTLKASAFGDPMPSCVDNFGHGVWYVFTAPVAGQLIVDTFGSDFDTGLAIYTGTCDALTEVACDDDTGGIGVTSQVIMPTTAGTTYFILAGGYQSDSGNLVLHLNHLTPPAFDVWPTNVSVVVSSNAIFNPTVSGTQPMSFRWFFNNAPLTDGGRISGSTNSMLVIANVQTNDGGNYQLVASNIVGVTTSAVAVLTPIILPPTITTPPVTQAVPQGSNVTFFAAVNGTPPYAYQWLFDGTPLVDDGVHIVGAATSSLSISNLTTLDAGSYTLIVTNLSGSDSASATLIVMTPPVITIAPVGRSVPPGLPTTFNAAASGIPAPYYRWQLNGTNLTDWSFTNALTLPAVGTNDLGAYQVVAQNSVGSVTSAVAQLTFGPVAAWGRNSNNESLPPPGLANVIAVAGNYTASYALRNDATVTVWGNPARTNVPAAFTNVVALATDGNTGVVAVRNDGSVAVWNTFTAPALSNVVAVAASYNAAFALRAEGTVIGWGTVPYSTVPAGLNHVTAIAASLSHALALRDNGTVVGWGTTVATNIPANLTNVVAIAACSSCSFALKANGSVVAWGTGSRTNLPPGLTNIIAISVQNYGIFPVLCLATRADGTVVAWGDNTSYGETNLPTGLNKLFTTDIAAAMNHGLALVNDGKPQIVQPPVGLTAFYGRDVALRAVAVAAPNPTGASPLSYQWLFNGTNLPNATNASLSLPNIQLANAGSYQLLVSNSVGTALSLPAPLTVISNNTLTFLAQSSVSASNVYQGGKVTFYGGPVLGNGPLRYQWFWSPTNRNYSAVPGATNDTLALDPALAWQSGNYYLSASNGFVQPPYQTYSVTSAPASTRILFARAWGYNAVSNPPVNVTNAISLATGGSTGNVSPFYGGGDYFAVGADGKVTAWANYLPFYGETNVSALSNSFVTAIAATAQHTLALKSDGTVVAFGYGFYGQTNVPAGLNNVTAIDCGGYHDLALKSDGTVVGWGAGSTALPGQYNYGQATNNPAATNVVAIAAGNLHSLALRADGTAVAWGYSYDGSTIVPFNATNLVAIAAGSGFSVGLRANGTVVQWGNGLGNYPVPANLSNVVSISASATHCTALKNDGTVTSWGYGYNTSNISNNVPSDLANVAAITSGGDHDFALLGTRAPSFAVQPWNRTVFNNVTSVWFAAKCVGVQPVTYQWRCNGTNIPSATNDILTVTGASGTPFGGFQPIAPGNYAYQLVVSNAYGVVLSKPVKLSVQIPLGFAVNATNLNWLSTNSAPWYGQTNYTHDAVAAARSGGIGGSQETVLQTVLTTNVPGTLSFWWKVSSEQYFDTLEFRVNGAVQTNISGEVDWQQASFFLPAGTNVLQWRYSKDASFDAGLDAGFVDQVSFASGPKILVQPQSVTANFGTTVTLSVVVSAMPPLGFQWQQNGNPVGGNASLLTLPNAGRAQDGVYSVIVTNAGGMVVSSNAVVQINVPQLLSSPTLMPDGSLQFTSADLNGGLLTDADLPNFEAQASSDLVNWVTLPNALSLSNGMLQLSDASRTNYPARYYRIVEH